MRCKKCNKNVENPTWTHSWEKEEICLECYDYTKFAPEQIMKVTVLSTVQKGEILRLKSTPIDFWLDIQVQREMIKNE